MSFEGFEHLLESLSLAEVFFNDHDVHDHHGGGSKFRRLHDGGHHHRGAETQQRRKNDDAGGGGGGHRHEEGHAHARTNDDDAHAFHAESSTGSKNLSHTNHKHSDQDQPKRDHADPPESEHPDRDHPHLEHSHEDHPKSDHPPRDRFDPDQPENDDDKFHRHHGHDFKNQSAVAAEAVKNPRHHHPEKDQIPRLNNSTEDHPHHHRDDDHDTTKTSHHKNVSNHRHNLHRAATNLSTADENDDHHHHHRGQTQTPRRPQAENGDDVDSPSSSSSPQRFRRRHVRTNNEDSSHRRSMDDDDHDDDEARKEQSLEQSKRKKRRIKEKDEKNQEEMDDFVKHHDEFHITHNIKEDSMHSPPKDENDDCFSTRSYWFNKTKNFEVGLSPDMFFDICPSLIYQIDTGACSLQKRKDRFGHFVRIGEIPVEYRRMSVALRCWGYAFGAILIVSLCGVVGVAIVPIMTKAYYESVLQFFVALAIGSLSGDALLHLLPHALAIPVGGGGGGHTHADHEDVAHVIGVGKGLMATAGLFAFFLIERFMVLFQTRKEIKKKGKRLSREVEATTTATPMILTTKDDDEDEDEDVDRSTGIKLDEKMAKEKDARGWENSDVDNAARERDHDHNKHAHAHGHSHHGHADGIKIQSKSLSSLALMVILGDGIHNFCDGMAIGAAFVASPTMGLSTTVAVVCHELPHEIGDFAVLINTGMSLKKAFFYNIVSSVLSLIGMICGVLIAGSFHETSSWIFAMTAGSFLYISLADLLPELSTTSLEKSNANDADANGVNGNNGNNHDVVEMSRHSLSSPYKLLLLQLCGIFLGIFIMGLIGVYEENLKRIFD